ncbi:hypothetical protein HDU98_003578 [Podochytrium sp. JEL0797]|nr:hypothetical protein HDU98_003578 [Podochytrium sp. JEL0797]
MHYWKLNRMVASAAIQRGLWNDAVSVAEKGVSLFPCSHSETVSLVVPFLAGIVKHGSIRKTPEMREDLDGVVAIRGGEEVIDQDSTNAFDALFALARRSHELSLISPDSPIPPTTETPNPSDTNDYSWISSLPAPTSLIYTTILLKYLLNTGSIVPAMNLFKSTLASPPHPLADRDIRTLYGTLIHGLARRNLITESLAILESGITNTTHGYYTPHVTNVGPILESMARKQQVSRMVELLEWLMKERKGFYIDARAFGTVYWGCLRAVGWKCGMAKRSKEKGVDGVAEFWGMRHAEREELVLRARKIYLEGVERLVGMGGATMAGDLRSSAYSAMIHQHILLKELPFAESALRESIDRGIQVSVAVLNKMKMRYAPASDGRKAIESEIRRIRRSFGGAGAGGGRGKELLGDESELHSFDADMELYEMVEKDSALMQSLGIR